jgi:ATP-binding cassette subfamily F protein 3
VPDKPESYVRGVLGAFLFSGDDIDKPIGILSGGEKARVALAKLLYLPGNFLLMDEPTNHLDVDSSEALIQALKSYQGTILFVSHNRSFLNQLATQIWEAREGTVIRHPGNLDDYLYHLRQERTAPPAAPAQGEAAGPGLLSQRPNKKELRRTEAEERKRRSAVERPLRREIERLESRIAAIESDQKRCEAALADPVLYSDFSRAKPLMEAHRANKAELEALLERWEEKQKALAALPL